MLTDARLKQIMYVGQRRGELHREAVRQAHAEGQVEGRKEERARIKNVLIARLDELRDWYAETEIGAILDFIQTIEDVLAEIDAEDTSHE